MTHSLILLLTIFVSAPSYALSRATSIDSSDRAGYTIGDRARCNPLFNESNFYVLDQLPGVIDTMTATPKLEFTFRNSEGQFLKSSCSSSIISDSGLILTAAHCVTDCIESAQNKQDGAEMNAKNEASCPMIIDGKPNLVTVKVVGRCSTAEILASTRESGDGGDFETRGAANKRKTCLQEDEVAILEPFNPDKSAHCLPLNFSEPALNQRLATQGYPSKTTRLKVPNPKRGSARDAPGDTLTWSTGKRVDQGTCELEIHKNGKIIHETARLLQNDMARERYIQTTVDLVGGGSGGPLLNAEGEVVGIGSFTDSYQRDSERVPVPAQPLRQECKGSTYFSPTSKIKAMIEAQAPELLNQLKCEAQRAKQNADVNI